MTQSNHTLLVLGKDLLFILLSVLIVVKGNFLFKVLGILALVWYGRDFWYRGKGYLASMAPKRDVERPADPKRQDGAPIVDDGKIQVTDLSGAKEVDFEKE